MDDKATLTTTTRQSKFRRVFSPPVLAFVVVITAFFLFLVYLLVPPNVWEETTVPFDPECLENCESVGTIGGSHGTEGAEFMINRTVDDDIAQWGDCLESIFICISLGEDPNGSMEEKTDLVRECIAASACPEECTSRYARKSSSSPEAAQQAFFDVFIGDNAWCLPKGDKQ